MADWAKLRQSEGLKFDHWIGGSATKPHRGEYLNSVSPGSGKHFARIARGDHVDVELAAQAARRAKPAWASLPPAGRSQVLFTLAAAIRKNAAYLVDLEVGDTGKIERAARAEIEGSAAYFEYYAGIIRSFHGETIDLGPGQHSFTLREPYGVVGVITPWNVPLNQLCRAIAPAMSVGNAVLVKPSEFTSSSSVAFARIASEAGLPDGVLNVITGLGTEVGTPIIENSAVSRVTFTGSVATGREIARLAAQRLIPATLELGGKSPHIIFADADLPRAVDAAVRAFTSNAGQACSAGTRLLVESAVHDEVVEAVVAAASKIRAGIDIGPMITQSQFDKVKGYFRIATAEGAVLRTGGAIDESPNVKDGLYLRPTVYTNVANQMRIAQEEIFGPVLVVIPFDTEQEAVAIANDSPYGLVAGLWTRDLARALRLPALLEAGQVFVNDWTGNVEGPFGGVKQSGYGREKGIESLNDYTQLKTVMIRV